MDASGRSYDIRNGKHGGLSMGSPETPTEPPKIGYRGTKFTNPQTQSDGTPRSIPITRWTQEPTRQLPLTAARVIRATEPPGADPLPDQGSSVLGLMVATGGSGHGFKFLPNLGRYVVDRIEGKHSVYLDLWKWRSLTVGEEPYNSSMEGSGSQRSLHCQDLTKEDGLTKQKSRLYSEDITSYAPDLRSLPKQAFVTSEGGNFGLGHQDAEPGDIICAILGCRVLVILRPVTGGNFHVVGSCYLHGFSSAEAFLGPLPEPWVMQYLLDSSGIEVPYFFNKDMTEEAQ
ncbi:hypothetical protein ACJZ2D_011068 [Fusarium nematophilum]